MSVARPTRVQMVFFFCSGFSVSYLAPRDLHPWEAYQICEASFLIHHGGNHDLCIYKFVCP